MSQTQTQEAIFLPDGEFLIPTEFAGGPWSAGAQHGGAVAGALARAVETLVPEGMRVTRLAIDLLGEVPLERLRAEAEIVRPGKRIQLARARLVRGERVLASATAQMIRSEPVPDVEPWVDAETPHPRVPPAPQTMSRAGIEIPGFVRAMDFGWAGDAKQGDRIMWTRLRMPLVAGEGLTPFVRLATAADFASGAGNDLDFTRFVSINPDLTLHIEREPRSEWVGVTGSTSVRPDGTGQSLGAIFDLEGRVARAQASLYVAAR